MQRQEAIHYFTENGFVILPELFSESEISSISQEIDKILTGTARYVPKDSLVYEPGSSPPVIRNVFTLHRFNPMFMNIAQRPRIVSLVEQILASPLRLYSSQLFAKPAAVGSQVPLHQDMPYWPFEPPEMLSAWIALDDSTTENGCVRFLAGSHRLGLLRHVPSGVVGNSLRLEDARVAGISEVAAEVRRGSCVLHHCLTAHRSEPNRSAKPRRGLIYIYMSSRVRLTDPSRIRGEVYFPLVSGS